MKNLFFILIVCCSLKGFGQNPIDFLKRSEDEHLNGKVERVIQRNYRYIDSTGSFEYDGYEYIVEYDKNGIEEVRSTKSQNDLLIVNTNYDETTGSVSKRICSTRTNTEESVSDTNCEVTYLDTINTGWIRLNSKDDNGATKVIGKWKLNSGGLPIRYFERNDGKWYVQFKWRYDDENRIVNLKYYKPGVGLKLSINTTYTDTGKIKLEKTNSDGKKYFKTVFSGNDIVYEESSNIKGVVVERVEYEYGLSGLLNKVFVYGNNEWQLSKPEGNKNNKEMRLKRTIVYKYDQNGNWILRETISDKIVVYKMEREISYFD